MFSEADTENVAIKDGGCDEAHEDDDTNLKAQDESESLSDIDDLEVLNHDPISIHWLLISSHSIVCST